ncbi:toprim domain-containing protein [Dasania sp. GY-MA-18]|uniref:Toprim domain-containing protein n=1 Tax=Dasania phycosphaerae TaxID=2950436 RepID=A0A9J6RMB7_9GAMM|nr:MULTISPECIES: toprim domain-containing protein [Dasania]MCR8922695.1 toprim domain-containing protein [Dasania sp. GY-MA-18]MCZ0865125.1 toprim domain-containing protein [Dasania phycosphaerae]MCZ0868851.1 toprim domain-containing protein [Dasania phycosphaerae]
MASIEQLKQRISCEDLAERLGLERPGNTGNFKSPHRDDNTPSLSVYDNGRKWVDHGAIGAAGSCIDLIMYVEKDITDVAEAMQRLHKLFDIPFDKVEQPEQKKARTQLEGWADAAIEKAERAKKYLMNERKIPEAVVMAAIKAKTLGFSDYTNPKYSAGEKFFGGDSVVFVVKDLATREVVALDHRYEDKALNGGMKTKTLGPKAGHIWTINYNALKHAHTIVVVEGPLDALSIEAAGLKGYAAIALRKTTNILFDWSFAEGKKVIVLPDNDQPDDKGVRPGMSGAWQLHEHLTSQNISCLFVDIQREQWIDQKDANDYLKTHGREELGRAIKQLEHWLIPGLPGGDDKPEFPGGKRRVYLPVHDFSKYWLYRVKEDFTSYVKLTRDEDTNETKESFEDLCGFRVAALSSINIASAMATMSGEKDTSPHTIFSASVQIPRHGPKLVRRVFDDDELHNPDRWKKFGPIYKPAQFSRMLNILERTTEIGAREAVNFVGLAWQNCKPIVNEGKDCFFTEPDKQCPYHNLTFPSGSSADAFKLVSAYQQTFKHNAASQLLVWALGAHLKAFLGFWPHMILQADKGSGKSVLVKRLERSIGFTMLSGQSLQTEFRLLTSVSHTSHPVGWEELSARKQDVIDKAVAMLQESYQHTVTRRGSDMTEYLICAPVLLAGEDVPVDSLLGKVVRTELAEKGPMLPETLPRFPVRQWLQFLAGLTRMRVMELYEKCLTYCENHNAGNMEDNGAQRMTRNYAAVMCAWGLLCEFGGIESNHGRFVDDLTKQMNTHVLDTKADREPWVWIMGTILGEIDANRYSNPYKFEQVTIDGDQAHEVIFIRTTHIMHHFSTSPALRDKFNSLPVKSSKVLGHALRRAGVVVVDDAEKAIHQRRVAHMQGLSLTVMREFGLSVSMPDSSGKVSMITTPTAATG